MLGDTTSTESEAAADTSAPTDEVASVSSEIVSAESAPDASAETSSVETPILSLGGSDSSSIENTVDASAPASTDATVADTTALPQDVLLNVVDANGDSAPLASQEAAQIIAAPDPYFVSGGVTYAFTSADCDPTTDGDQPCDNPIQTAIDFAATHAPDDGVINVESGVYNENVTIDSLANLTLQGGVNGGISALNGSLTISNATAISIINFLISNGVTITDSTNVVVLGTAGDDTLVVAVINSSDVTLGGGEGNDNVTITGVNDDGTITVTGDAGDDTLNVDNSQGVVIPVAGGVEYDGGAGGYDTLNITGGSFVNETYTAIDATSGEFNFDGAEIRFTNLEPVSDLSVAANVTYGTGGGFAVSTNGNDTITVRDYNGATDGASCGVGVTCTTIAGAGELVKFANKTNVTIDAANGNDTVTLDITTRATGLNTLTLNGGGGNDTINGGTGSDTIDGGAGTDTFTVDGTAGNDTFTVSSTQVVRNAETISYSNIETLTVNGGNGNDTFNATSSATTTININGDANTDTLVFNTEGIATTTGPGNRINVTGRQQVNYASIETLRFLLTITAANKTKTYGTALTFDTTTPSTDFSVAGLVNSDTVTSITLTSAGAAAAATVAGSPYAIVPSAAVGTGLGNYIISYVNGALTVTKANAVISVTPYNVTYDGAAHTATGSATGVLGEALSGLDLSNTTHTNAGTYAADFWTFTDVTGNYNNASGTVNDVIGKANAVIVVTPYNVTYDGAAHTATGSATGVLGEALSGLDLSNTTHTNAGTCAADFWTFTDVTGNYNNVGATTITDTINARPITVTAVTDAKVYDGTTSSVGTPTITSGTLDHRGRRPADEVIRRGRSGADVSNHQRLAGGGRCVRWRADSHAGRGHGFVSYLARHADIGQQLQPRLHRQCPRHQRVGHSGNGSPSGRRHHPGDRR